MSEPTSIWSIEPEGSNATGPIIVVGDARLATGLAAALDAGVGDQRPEEAPRIVIVARGGTPHVTPDLHRWARLIVLLDPLSIDRVRILEIAAGRSECRLVTVPSLNAIAKAEHAMALILALSRQLLPAYSELFASATGHARRLPRSVEQASPNWLGLSAPGVLFGRTLGVIGLGRSGGLLAERSRAFGMTVTYVDEEPRPVEELRLGLRRRRLDQLLRESDVVSLHLPLTKATARLIDAPELASMPEHALLINVSHGGLVDEGALIKALRQRQIAGAGLDVFAYEPLAGDSPLLALDNVVLTPHIGGISQDDERGHFIHRTLEAINAFAND